MFWLYMHVLMGVDVEPQEHFENWAKRLAFMARYGRIPPSESARYPRAYFDALERAVAELIEEERPDPS